MWRLLLVGTLFSLWVLVYFYLYGRSCRGTPPLRVYQVFFMRFSAICFWTLAGLFVLLYKGAASIANSKQAKKTEAKDPLSS